MKRSELRELIREVIVEAAYRGKKLKDLSKDELKRLLIYHKQNETSTRVGTNKRTIKNWHHVQMIKDIEALLGIPADKRTFPPKPPKSSGSGAASPSGTTSTRKSPESAEDVIRRTVASPEYLKKLMKKYPKL